MKVKAFDDRSVKVDTELKVLTNENPKIGSIAEVVNQDNALVNLAKVISVRENDRRTFYTRYTVFMQVIV
jgi:hypothetical protein